MRFHFNRRVSLLATALWTAAGGAAPAYAIDRFWNVGTGLWTQSANWSPAGIPQPADSVFLGYFGNGTSGLARLNTEQTPAVTAASVYNGGTLLIANGGSLLIGTDLVLGRNSTHGTLNITNPNPIVAYWGGMTVVNNVRLGVLSGVGHVNQNDGTLIVGTSIIVGDSRDPSSIFNPAGTYSLTNIGYVRTPNLHVGFNNNSSGTFNLSGFAHLRVNNDVRIGGTSGAGTFNQTGGLIEAPGSMLITSPASGPASTYTLSGGTFDSRLTQIGRRATFQYNGGTMVPRFLHLTNDGRILVSPGGNKVLDCINLIFHSDDAYVDLSNKGMRLANVFLAHVLREHLARGYNGGNWLGKGITSSAAAAVAASGSTQRTALGYTVDPFHYHVKYTRSGDSNLDGAVNLADFNALAANFGQSNRFWWQGDFNYDGFVNLADFNLLAANFGLAASGPDVTPDDWSALAAAVPEPALAPAVMRALAMLARRRRR